jgi:hypothetical protein
MRRPYGQRVSPPRVAPCRASTSAFRAAHEHERWGYAHFAVTTAQGDAANAQRRAAHLRQLSGVKAVTLNRICGTLSVEFDRARISASELARSWTWRDDDVRRRARCAERLVDGLCSIPVLARIGRALIAHARA